MRFGARLWQQQRTAARLLAVAQRMASTSAYPFLEELGLKEDNVGVYDGEWNANGEVVESTSPYTNEVIARIQTGSVEDYERGRLW